MQRTVVVGHICHSYLLLLFVNRLGGRNGLLGESLVLLKHLHRLVDNRIVLVDVLIPSLVVEHVVDHAAVDVAFQQFVRLADEQVAALQTVLVGIGGKLVNHVLLVQIVGQLHHLLEVVQLRTVVVGIGEGELQDESAHACLLEVGCHSQSILGYEDVGSDTASAIYGASQSRVIGRTRMLDAVLREELAMLIAVEQVLLIVLVVTQGVRFLYASTRWGVVACNGESYHAVVGEFYLLLYQSLSEGTSAYDGGTVIVLHGSCKDFGSRC